MAAIENPYLKGWWLIFLELMKNLDGRFRKDNKSHSAEYKNSISRYIIKWNSETSKPKYI